MPEASAANKKRSFKDTLNLPKTDFPMKAGLVKNEPASLERWAGLGVYERLRERRAGGPAYVFHDGPPYANGSIHLGHLMNKCLKDFVVRTRSVMGFDCPYTPGWDCHGLPIEHKVMAELVESGEAAKLGDLPPDEARMAVRRACERYATENVGVQMGQMQRLLTLADYADPYLTMKPAYEGAVLEVLSGLLERGLVYRALKPVHWSIANETALADAELEYEDREDLSVYVDFEAAEADAVYDAFGLPPAPEDDDEQEDPEPGAQARRPSVTPSFMIWTTTPWTLPANLAIAVKDDIRYALARIDGAVTVLAEKLIDRVTDLAKAEDVEVLGTATGAELVGLRYKHPFIDAPPRPAGDPGADVSGCYRLVAADYVTLEDGTGLVHTAPGHGTEDYQTGLRVGLPTYCPVTHNGTYDETVPEWLRGMSVWKANDAVYKRLHDSGHLFHGHRFTHSYPHDWRSKTPVIFRCTEQWFVSVDRGTSDGGAALRERALGAVAEERAGDDGVRFVPAWGRNRMRGMLESRPDWCISRQRSWGLPIPAFELPDGSSFMTAQSCAAVAKRFREVGSDAWFTETPASLLRHYDPSADPLAPEAVRAAWAGGAEAATAGWKHGGDILDVWFESGSSWNAVLRERLGDAGFPAELYLEGSDQHRGWFQLSLLPALGVMGRPPFKALFTHGFCVDKEGKKLSKSAGHTIENLFEKYGADVLRWWVAGSAYEGDVKVDDEFFALAGESYRKIRNTLRFLLGNLFDFDPQTDRVPASEIGPTTLEAWILAEHDRVRERVLAAYERLDFRDARAALYDVCNEALSATYLAATKDRLYCDRATSPARRRAQTAMYDLCDSLCKLLAPLLPHTADEAWRLLPGAGPDACVHLETVGQGLGVPCDEGWSAVLTARDRGLKALEVAKGERGIENPLDAGLVFADPDGVLGRFDPLDLADLCGVSRARVDAASPDVVVEDLREAPRCERSRKRDGTVRARSLDDADVMLSDRDAEAIGAG